MQNCTVSLPFPTGLFQCDGVDFSELTKLLITAVGQNPAVDLRVFCRSDHALGYP